MMRATMWVAGDDDKEASTKQQPKGQRNNESKHVAMKDEKLQQRLARNRATARARREKKKALASRLTEQVAELQAKICVLHSALDKLPPAEKASILKAAANNGEPRVACIFCDLDFVDKAEADNHMLQGHAPEFKSREKMVSNPFPSVGSSSSCGSDDGMNNEEGQENPHTSRLSQEERRKRRLQRNAMSARLCRQRKKRYVEELRLQLPLLRHKLASLRMFVPNSEAILANSPKDLASIMENMALSVSGFSSSPPLSDKKSNKRKARSMISTQESASGDEKGKYQEQDSDESECDTSKRAKIDSLPSPSSVATDFGAFSAPVSPLALNEISNHASSPLSLPALLSMQLSVQQLALSALGMKESFRCDPEILNAALALSTILPFRQ